MAALFLSGCSENENKNSSSSGSAGATSVSKESSTAVSSESSMDTTDEAVGAELTAGVFEYLMKPEGHDPMYNFLRFYENGVFYASIYGGSQHVAGVYEVIDEACEYEESGGTKKQAPKAIAMTNVDGSDYVTVAYDDENGVIGDFEPFFMAEFVHNLNPDAEITEETGVTMAEYVLGENEYSVVAIKHNGTYQDTIGLLLEGNWLLEGDTYTLTDEESGDSYTLTLQNEGDNAEYVGPDGSKETLNLLQNAEVMTSFIGEVSTETYGVLDAVIDCLDNGDTTLKVTIGGGVQDLPGGSWELSESKTSITLSVNENEYTADMNMEDNSFSFEMILDVGDTQVNIPMSTAE